MRELSQQLIAMGHEVAIVAPDKRTLPSIKHYNVRVEEAVFVGHPEWKHAKKLETMEGKVLANISTVYLKTALRAVEEFKPDVVHAFHTAFLPEIARVIKAYYGTRFLITTHGSDLSYMVKDRRFLPLVSDANKAAKFITAVSDFTKNWYLDIFGEELRRKVSVIVGGVNLNHYKRDPKLIKQIDSKYGIAGKRVVLFTGRLTKHKGVINLIKAAYRIKAIVVIVGDGPERGVIENEIKERGLPNIVMVGYMNTHNPLFHAFYERADVYVSPSVWDEPLGLTILEAMAAYTPVVATRKGGVQTIIKDGINGFLIPPRNSLEISQFVNRLLADNELRETVGKAAYETVLNKFSWPKIANQFEKLYIRAKGKERYRRGPLDEVVKRIFPNLK